MSMIMIWRHVHVLLISQYWLLRVNIHSKSLESLDHRAPWLPSIVEYIGCIPWGMPCHVLQKIINDFSYFTICESETLYVNNSERSLNSLPKCLEKCFIMYVRHINVHNALLYYIYLVVSYGNLWICIIKMIS